MAFLIKIFLITFLLTSCSKLPYLTEQWKGQRGLINNARDNQEVLDDPKVSGKQKEVIKKIIDYKKYFYKYWEEKPSSIYDKTTFLEGKAVTYLVIASPHDEIKAKQECFPFFGCFPYLGFFKAESARKHARELSDEGWITYIRPVYVYSTLGYYDDPILSSMFNLRETSLAETVFHELFHTKFFIKDEVDLNEAMANLVGKEMAEIYFSVSPEEKKKRILKKKKYEVIDRWIVKMAQSLNQKYKAHKSLTPKLSKTMMEEFLDKEFLPGARKKCEKLGFKEKDCYPLRRTWNNASFTGFLTYEKNAEKLTNLKKKLGVDLRGFVEYLNIEYEKFKKSDRKVRKKGFSRFLNL
jgi:predicted aminopeptidase